MAIESSLISPATKWVDFPVRYVKVYQRVIMVITQLYGWINYQVIHNGIQLHNGWIYQLVMVFFHGQLLGHRRVTHFLAVPPSRQQQRTAARQMVIHIVCLTQRAEEHVFDKKIEATNQIGWVFVEISCEKREIFQ